MESKTNKVQLLLNKMCTQDSGAVWKNGLSSSASLIFPDPPESLESDSITCHPLDQSLFVYCLLSQEVIRELQCSSNGVVFFLQKC